MLFVNHHTLIWTIVLVTTANAESGVRKVPRQQLEVGANGRMVEDGAEANPGVRTHKMQHSNARTVTKAAPLAVRHVQAASRQETSPGFSNGEWDEYDMAWPPSGEQWMRDKPQSFAERKVPDGVAELYHPSLLNNPANGRDWLLQAQKVQLAFDQKGPNTVQVNKENVRYIRGHGTDWQVLGECARIQKMLTLWAAIVSTDKAGEEIVEHANVQAEPVDCAWRVSFKPREARTYAIHVKTLWWNEKVEPAYNFDTTLKKEGCNEGNQILLRPGWQWAGGKLYSAGPWANMVKPQCADLCTYDERCVSFNLKQYGAIEECLLFGGKSRVVPGNCTSGHPKTDRGLWQYLGGWNVFRRSIKDDVVHARAHIWGSPFALPTAFDAMSVAEKAATTKLSDRPCAGREDGRWRIVDGISRKSEERRIEYQPYDCKVHSPKKEDVLRCFQKRNITSITLAGDSLIQEQFEGFRHILGNGTNDIKGVIDKKVRQGEITATRPDGVTVTVKLQQGNPRGLKFAELAKENVLITNLMAQHVIWHGTTDEIESDIRHAGEGFRANPSKQTRIYFSGVYLHSMRQSYIFPGRMERHNKAADRYLSPAGFRYFDAWGVTKIAGNLTSDGMHLVEKAFNAVTPLLVTMICQED